MPTSQHLTLWLTLLMNLHTQVNAIFVLKTFKDAVIRDTQYVYNVTSICRCKISCLVDEKCLGVTASEDGGDPLCSALKTDGPSWGLRKKRSADPEHPAVTPMTVFISTTTNKLSFIKIFDDDRIVIDDSGQTGPSATETDSGTTATITSPTTSASTISTSITITTPTSSTTIIPPECSDSSGSEPYFTFEDADSHTDAEKICLMRGRRLAAITSQEDLGCFLKTASDTSLMSETLIHVSLLKKKENKAIWKPQEPAFHATYLGKKNLPFYSDGRGTLLAEFDIDTKALVGFYRPKKENPLGDKSAVCMDATGERIPSYMTIPLDNDEWYDTAKQKCQDQGKVLAVVKTQEDYVRLQSQLPSVTKYLVMALDTSKPFEGIEWEYPELEVKYTEISNEVLVEDEGGSGNCYHISSFDPNSTPKLTFKKGCSGKGKAACTPHPKMAEPEQRYEYQTKIIKKSKRHWMQIANEGLQHAVLKTKEQINGVIANITLDESDRLLTVSMHWNSALEMVLWEDDTPYDSTPLAQDPDTVEHPPPDKKCYFVHFSNGVYKGFKGKPEKCTDKSYEALGMAPIP